MTEAQQQMSIGSVGSIAASPMHQNLSVHSQPSSIPINEQGIVSPIAQSPLPVTPENHSERKPDIQNLNILNNNDNAVAGSSKTDSDKEGTSGSSQLDHKEFSNLKRPALTTRDFENVTDDYSLNQSLYDYTTWDAW